MDKKLAFELMRLVTSPHWAHFVKHLEAKQQEVVTEMLNASGEDVLKCLGKLRVYRDLQSFKDTVVTRHKEYKNG